MSDSDVLIKVEDVSKKFCRYLKQSLWYGVKDLTSELLGRDNFHKDLRKDEFWSVKGVSFELKRGECLGLVGRNGAGKSTLLKMLNGLIKPDKGKITCRGRMGALIELGAGFNPILTGKENIYINASVLGMIKSEVDKKLQDIIDFAEIGEFIDTPVQSYSSGMKVRLGFAIAAQINPDILLIDEVLAVGDIGFTIKCINEIDKISRNSAIVFVSHSMPLVTRICSDLIVMDSAKVVYQGNNVPEGIECYYSRFESEKGSISGSGKASIKEIKLYSDNNVESDSSIFKIQYLDNLYIEVALSIDPSIKRCLMSCIFNSMGMYQVAQCHSKNCGFDIINTGDVIKARLKIPKLQLNPGIYSITIVIMEKLAKRVGEVLVRHQAIRSFQVTGEAIGWAPVQLQGEWDCVKK